MPLRGAQGDAGEHSTSAALQPGLQAGLVPAPDNRSHGTQGPVRGQESGTLGSAGGRAQQGRGRAQRVRGQRFPECGAGRMSRTVWEGSFYK